MDAYQDAAHGGNADVNDVAHLAGDPKELENGKIYAVLKGNQQVGIVDTMNYLAYTPKPPRPTRKVVTLDPDSFIAYIRDNADTDITEVFAKGEPKPRFVCVFDADRWREDRVYLDLKTSPEWDAGNAANGKLLSQDQFADFIEDQLSTIAAPEGAVLLEIVQSMQGYKSVNWKSADWLANGQRQFAWEEAIEAKAGRTGKLEIPAQFTLALRPFMGSEPFAVTANLRYRINNGNLAIGFKLVEPERRMEVAVDDVMTKVANETNLTVLAGWPD
jgi:uncharacterized protein YfdQ (DUF2303 family)